MNVRFSSLAFASIGPILENIHRHPFNSDLAKGTLPREQFVYYMQQDSLYLIDFARALALIGAKMRSEHELSLLLDFSKEALVAERELHRFYFKEYHVTPVREKGPACFAYTAHLLTTAALGSPAEGMAAVLPCFWIYREAGRHILKQSSVHYPQADLKQPAPLKQPTPQNPYSKWIETYSCKEYTMLVDKAMELTDRLHEDAGEAERETMIQAFVDSSRMEYMFWDDAAKMRQWSV